jgi:hypothetical protein
MKMSEAKNEICLTLIGKWLTKKLWVAKGHWLQEGHPTQVGFEHLYNRILRKEIDPEKIIGFYHTHPKFRASPSLMDHETMNQWVDVLGKPLLCLIEGVDGLNIFYFFGDWEYYHCGKGIRDGKTFVGKAFQIQKVSEVSRT